jgi:outer membrane protein
MAGRVQAQSLEQLYQSARAHDASFRAARALAASASHRTEQSRALLRPTATLAGSAVRSRLDPPAGALNPTGAAIDTNRVGVTIEARQPLYNRAHGITIEQTARAQELSQADLAMAEHDLMLRLAQSYFDLLAAEDVLTAALAGEKAIDEQLAAANRAYEVGTATITDAREARARADLAVAQRLVAHNDARIKRLALMQLAGVREVRPHRLAADARLPAVVPDSIEHWADQSHARNPGARRAELALDVAKLETDKARAGHMPTVDLVGSVGPSRSTSSGAGSTLGATADGNTLNASVGVQMAVPLYQGGATQSRIHETLLLQEKAGEELELARRALAQNARTAFLSVQSGQARVKALEAAESSTRLALQATQTGYRVGVRVNIDVLNAQTQLFQTRRDLAIARYETLLATLRLKQAAGTLSVSDLADLDRLMPPAAAQ